MKENNIQALILDVDNTLLDFDLNYVEGLLEWYNNIKENGIKCMIVSNSNKTQKVEMVANFLNISYTFSPLIYLLKVESLLISFLLKYPSLEFGLISAIIFS